MRLNRSSSWAAAAAVARTKRRTAPKVCTALYSPNASGPATHEVLPPFEGVSVIPAVDFTTLPVPRMERSVLAKNGLRVASQETYGQLCNFGVLVSAGSRVESAAAGNRGATHLMEMMAFKTTHRRGAEQMYMDIADMGGATVAYSARDLVLYNVEVLREFLDPAMEWLGESLLMPRFEETEIEEMRHIIGLQAEQLPADMLLKDALHGAAFGEATPLGQSHFCPADMVPRLNRNMLLEYQQTHYTADNMVLVGAGVEHDEFARLAEKYFGALPSGGASGGESRVALGQSRRLSPYVGGEARKPCDLMLKEEWSHVAIGWKSSWGDCQEDRVPICVLQNLLGGGNSFSAGGPGKGMYSRL